MAFGPTGAATYLRRCARLSIPANARACPHIKPSRRPFRLSALCSNQVEQLPCGYGKNVGSSGNCRLDQTSGQAPASSLDRSSTTSLRQPDEVGLTLWDQGTGLNTLKGP